MKVTTYCINEGKSAQYYGLKNAEENQVLLCAPNNWRTEKSAINWAKNHGYEIVETDGNAEQVETGKKELIAIKKALEHAQDVIALMGTENYPFTSFSDPEIRDMFYELNSMSLQLIGKIEAIK